MDLRSAGSRRIPTEVIGLGGLTRRRDSLAESRRRHALGFMWRQVHRRQWKVAMEGGATKSKISDALRSAVEVPGSIEANTRGI